MMNWGDLSLEDLEREYSPSSCIDNLDKILCDYRKNSKRAESEASCIKNIRYGTRQDEILDVFPSIKADSPLLIFIHGGYWQQLNKDDSTFPGAALSKRNIGYAAIDYTIAPEASIDVMIAQCCQSIVWLANNAEKYGFSSQKIYLSGSSAGAHLVIMALLKLRESNLKAYASIKGIILLSGIYNLEPIVETYINKPLGLTVNTARALSPILYDLTNLPKAIICWGENETSEFKRQSQEFAKSYALAGNVIESFELSNYNHFNNVYMLEDLVISDELFSLNPKNLNTTFV